MRTTRKAAITAVCTLDDPTIAAQNLEQQLAER
jgi:hypothetical protein